MASSAMGWSELLPELKELILDRLTSLSDHLRLASVCSSWRSSVVTIITSNRCPRLRLLPFLMLPPADKEKDNTTKIRPFFNLSSRKKINELHIPEIHDKWCCGSSQGWLLTVDGFTKEIQLFNPVSEGHIHLPSLSEFSFPPREHPPEPPTNTSMHYIHKAVLSSNPCTTPDYVVVVIVTNQKWLAYYKPGADKWTTIVSEKCCHFEDAIFYKQGLLLYAVSNHGPVVTYDFSSETPIEREITFRPPAGRGCDMYYLVESLGELLLVLRHFRWLDDHEPDGHYDDDDYKDIVVHPPFKFKTIKFWVRKLDESKREWIPIQSIGDDRILFLGNSSSISLSAQEFPECPCMGNSIYFNDDYDYGPFEPPSEGYHDTGVFNFETRRVESFLGSFPPHLTTCTFWLTPEPIGSVSTNFICKLFDIG
ncbi:putative F-box protein At5g55150 [Telopea speciosissima]|uniref:putative F-box protein At5g55150 n=1 Tax=Telopea speciosissima TaxID=54955 RepID=UPI001CC6F9B2|nr:putative F-box protein At5g55150 [Telopea speciosissima]